MVSSAGKEISKEEGVMPLIPSSTVLAWAVVVEHVSAAVCSDLNFHESLTFA